MRKRLHWPIFIVPLVFVVFVTNPFAFTRNPYPTSAPIHSGDIEWRSETYSFDNKLTVDLLRRRLSIDHDTAAPGTNSTPSSLRTLIHLSNSAQLILNEDLYGTLPSPKNPDLTTTPDSVFVIQAHNRSENLLILIETLKRVKNIRSSLLIFSTDFISNAFIQLVDSIRFARTLQIYYPHSIQVFPLHFPGADPPECARGSDLSSHVECEPVGSKDKFGHSRTGTLTQVKHHWLWKMRFVFDYVIALRHFTGNIIFLEDDNYVVEDILHIRKLVEQYWNPLKPHGIVAFGSYSECNPNKSEEVKQDYWVSSKHNMGIGIARSMWSAIYACLQIFCEFDDYNWDWSLQHLGRECIRKKLKVLQFSHMTRVYHLGICNGLHFHQSNCSAHQQAQKLTEVLSGRLLTSLYPEKLKFIEISNHHLMKYRVNGGWGDRRDQALCNSVVGAKWDPFLLKWYPALTVHSPIY